MHPIVPSALGEAIRTVRTLLEPEADETALTEAERIICHVLTTVRSKLYLDQSRLLSPAERTSVADLVRQRLTGAPLAYVLGNVYFHSKEFAVSPSVLIPRPETEVLVERVLESEPTSPRLFLDMGTGSGAIAETLVTCRDTWTAVAVDISSPAIAVARRNCSTSVRLTVMDRLEALSPRSRFDFIVSNPPYISAREMERLDGSVKDFEPPQALFGGDDGLDFYRYLAQHARSHLKPGGCLYCEIGADQGSEVSTLLLDHHWRRVAVQNDLAGRNRVVRAAA